MNWEAMGAAAEALGALGVILTLIYLAIQIRQNSRATLLAGYHEIANQWHTCSNLMIGTPDLASIVLRGYRSMDELTPEEALRFGAYMQTFFDVTESYYRFIVQLRLTDEDAVLRQVVGRRIVRTRHGAVVGSELRRLRPGLHRLGRGRAPGCRW